MATPNFVKPNYDLPYYVVSDKNGHDEYYYFSFESALKRINDELEFFEITLEEGYYSSASLNAQFKNDYYEYEDLVDLDDYDANYYFGDTAKNVQEKAKQEFESLPKLLQKIAYEWELIHIERVCVFSNGEAIYKEVK